MSAQPTEEESKSATDGRRGFVTALAGFAVGAVAALTPVIAGIRTLLHPLRRADGETGMVRVTSLQVLPADGAPQRFTIRADRTDAWTTYSDQPVGAVYLRRVNDEVSCFNVVCPHAGCFVGVAEDGSRFECPCHKSSFTLDGEIDDPSSPSPRGMDALDVEVRNGDELWVRFENFLPGQSEKTRRV